MSKKKQEEHGKRLRTYERAEQRTYERAEQTGTTWYTPPPPSNFHSRSPRSPLPRSHSRSQNEKRHSPYSRETAEGIYNIYLKKLVIPHQQSI